MEENPRILKRSEQLNLGQMIQKVKDLIKDMDPGYRPLVYYDFGEFFPVDPLSWRGAYSELSITYTHASLGTAAKPPSLPAFLEMLELYVDIELEGYKDGHYLMDEKTPVWVANYEDVSYCAVIDIIYWKHRVYIITGLCEY